MLTTQPQELGDSGTGGRGLAALTEQSHGPPTPEQCLGGVVGGVGVSAKWIQMEE